MLHYPNEHSIPQKKHYVTELNLCNHGDMSKKRSILTYEHIESNAYTFGVWLCISITHFALLKSFFFFISNACKFGV